MMYQILRDLQNNFNSIYENDKIITINKYLLHALNYPDMVTLIKKYRGDENFLKKELFNHIQQYETKSDPVNEGVQRRRNPMEDLLNDFMSGGLNGGSSFRGYNQSSIYVENDLNEIFTEAGKLEIPKLQRQASENGGILNPQDISLGSFLRALIEKTKSVQRLAYLYSMIQKSNFNIEKFIKDDKLGKSKNKKLIDELCVNLTKKAEDGLLQPVIGRQDEVEQVINILSKARKNNPILVGKAGVGKTAIVEGLALEISKGNVPETLKKAVVLELQVMNMVKGTQFRGQFEQKMSDLLEEFKDLEENGEFPILFIDEVHTIMGAGGTGSSGLDFSNIIKPALARGELRTIGATTTDEWYRFIKENPALDRRFVSVTVNEPSLALTKEILTKSIGFYQGKHGVTYSPEAIDRSIDLAKQFIVDNAFPDKAFDLLDYAGAMVNIKKGTDVTANDIEVALARHKNIDLDSIVETRKDSWEPLAPKIKKNIFGQDNAVNLVSRSVEKALAGLNASDKPYGAFLFTGPTGTGKTELAKQIAKEMKANFHRLDMSEFMEPHSVSKLIGSPAGYVGYDDGSSLTKIINENPRTVLLLDEIEKAHENVYKLFLQVMDHGKLTDSKGKEINFKNVLLIMTSNAGAKTSNPISLIDNKGSSNIDQTVIKNLFKPEFRARLTGNGPVEFNPLSMESLEKIVDKYINEIQVERLDKLKIKVKVSPEARAFLAQKGAGKDLGARPIKDQVERDIVDPLVEEVLYGKLKNLKKEKTVKVELVDEKIKLKL